MPSPSPSPKENPPSQSTGRSQEFTALDLDRYPAEVIEAVLEILRQHRPTHVRHRVPPSYSPTPAGP